jgi:hypothetical protein
MHFETRDFTTSAWHFKHLLRFQVRVALMNEVKILCR